MMKGKNFGIVVLGGILIMFVIAVYKVNTYVLNQFDRVNLPRSTVSEESKKSVIKVSASEVIEGVIIEKSPSMTENVSQKLVTPKDKSEPIYELPSSRLILVQ